MNLWVFLFIRCHLPSGKVAWLCEKHSKGNRITKLGVGSISVHGQGQTILNKEDELIKELLKSSPQAAALMGKPDREVSSLNMGRQPSLVRAEPDVPVVEEVKVKVEQNRDVKVNERKTSDTKKTTRTKGRTFVNRCFGSIARLKVHAVTYDFYMLIFFQKSKCNVIAM